MTDYFEDSWPQGWQNHCSTEFIMSDAFFQSKATWVPPEVKEPFDPKTCPAKCRRSGKCYATVYFNHKPGKPVPCSGKDCPWRECFADDVVEPVPDQGGDVPDKNTLCPGCPG